MAHLSGTVVPESPARSAKEGVVGMTLHEATIDGHDVEVELVRRGGAFTQGIVRGRAPNLAWPTGPDSRCGKDAWSGR